MSLALMRDTDEFDPIDVRRLWCAVIQRAIDDYLLGFRSQKIGARELHVEAQEWLFSDEIDFPSFRYLCEMMNVNFRQIRRGIENGQQLQSRRKTPSCEHDEFASGSLHKVGEGSPEDRKCVADF